MESFEVGARVAAEGTLRHGERDPRHGQSDQIGRPADRLRQAGDPNGSQAVAGELGVVAGIQQPGTFQTSKLLRVGSEEQIGGHGQQVVRQFVRSAEDDAHADIRLPQRVIVQQLPKGFFETHGGDDVQAANVRRPQQLQKQRVRRLTEIVLQLTEDGYGPTAPWGEVSAAALFAAGHCRNERLAGRLVDALDQFPGVAVRHAQLRAAALML